MKFYDKNGDSHKSILRAVISSIIPSKSNIYIDDLDDDIDDYFFDEDEDNENIDIIENIDKKIDIDNINNINKDPKKYPDIKEVHINTLRNATSIKIDSESNKIKLLNNKGEVILSSTIDNALLKGLPETILNGLLTIIPENTITYDKYYDLCIDHISSDVKSLYNELMNGQSEEESTKINKLLNNIIDTQSKVIDNAFMIDKTKIQKDPSLVILTLGSKIKDVIFKK